MLTLCEERCMLGFALTLVLSMLPTGPPPLQADVLIGAGHEGRPQSCTRFPKHKCNLGTAGERTYTPQVADEAARVLRRAGLSVIRVPADFSGSYRTTLAIFIHFDGDIPQCHSGASIGFHDEKDEEAARAWRKLYLSYWPFRFQADNFTTNLSNYYGFRQVRASDSALVLELGELTCPVQRAWLVPRLRWEGKLIAHFASLRVGRGNVPAPGPLRR